MNKLTIIIIALILVSIVIVVGEEQRQGTTKPEIDEVREWNFPPTAYKLENYPARKEMTTYDFIYGSTQISTLILSIVLFFTSLFVLIKSLENKLLSAWSFIAGIGIMFIIQQALQTLESFGIYSSTIQYFIPSIIIGLLIAGLLRQKSILIGCYK